MGNLDDLQHDTHGGNLVVAVYQKEVSATIIVQLKTRNFIFQKFFTDKTTNDTM